MAFTDLKKDELVEAVRFYKIDVDVNANKTALATALLDAGKTPEGWEADREAQTGESWSPRSVITTDDIKDEEEVVEETEEKADEEAPSEPESEEDEDMVLVRFIGRNRFYQTADNRKFTPNTPFALMSRKEYDALDRFKFREATKAEAEEFYAQ